MMGSIQGKLRKGEATKKVQLWEWRTEVRRSRRHVIVDGGTECETENHIVIL